MGQIADARARGAQAEAEETQSRRKLANAEAELKSLENKMKVFAQEAADSKRKLEVARAAVEGLTSRVERSGWDTEQDERLELGLKRAKANVTEGTEVGLLVLFLAKPKCSKCFRHGIASSNASVVSTLNMKSRRPTLTLEKSRALLPSSSASKRRTMTNLPRSKLLLGANFSMSSWRMNRSA